MKPIFSAINIKWLFYAQLLLVSFMIVFLNPFICVCVLSQSSLIFLFKSNFSNTPDNERKSCVILSV